MVREPLLPQLVSCTVLKRCMNRVESASQVEEILAGTQVKSTVLSFGSQMCPN